MNFGFASYFSGSKEEISYRLPFDAEYGVYMFGHKVNDFRIYEVLAKDSYQVFHKPVTMLSNFLYSNCEYHKVICSYTLWYF